MPLLVAVAIILGIGLLIIKRLGDRVMRDDPMEVSPKTQALLELSYVSSSWPMIITEYNNSMEVGQIPRNCFLLRGNGHVGLSEEDIHLTVDVNQTLNTLRQDLSVLMYTTLSTHPKLDTHDLMDDVTYALHRLSQIHGNLK